MNKIDEIKVKMLLEFMIKGVEEERSDRWVIHSEVFGFTAYGKSIEDARQSFVDMHVALVCSFTNPVKLRQYLEEKTAPPVYDDSDEEFNAFVGDLLKVSEKYNVIFGGGGNFDSEEGVQQMFVRKSKDGKCPDCRGFGRTSAPDESFCRSCNGNS